MIQAIGNKVVIRVIPEEEEATETIAVVKVRKDTLLKGEVESSGDDCLEVLPGDIVWFSAYGYEEVGEFAITTQDMIYAKIS